MKIFQSISDIPREELSHGYILTMGNFDGCHLGHQKLINLTISKLAAKQKSIVVSFRPHPKKILTPEKGVRLLANYDEKRKFIKELGVDYYVEIPFSRDLSTLAPRDFLDRYINICGSLKELVVGYDFSFGANKSGSQELLKSYCHENGIGFTVAESLEREGAPISSTRIWDLVASSEVETANLFLGRSFSISGIVIKGEGRGKKIGFPTANIDYFKDQVVPGNGVYVTKIQWGSLSYHSVTNIGHNPTFGEIDHISIETHILDFDKDIYGEQIEVEFLKFIRPEKKFNSVNELIDQISKDAESSRAWFAES